MSGIINALLATYGKRTLKLGSITVNSGGRYSGTADVSFSGGSGTGAAATANMGTQNINGVITSITGSQTNGYYLPESAAPTVTINQSSGGVGATATPNFGPSGLVAINYGGSARTTQQNGSLNITGGGGTGATGTYSGGIARYTFIDNVTIINGGSGYTSPPTIIWSNPDSNITVNAYPNMTVSISSGQITSIVVNSPGDIISNPGNDLFIGLPNFTLGGDGGGSGATFSRSTVITPIDYWVWGGIGGSPTITNPGSGYTSSPTITVSGQITGVIEGIVGKRVNSITVTNGGSGYRPDAPISVSISGGTPVPTFLISHNWTANGTWDSYNFINSISITNAGTGYTSAPAISFSGGGQSVAATATANMIPE